jgi:hypothetical protein
LAADTPKQNLFLDVEPFANWAEIDMIEVNRVANLALV